MDNDQIKGIVRWLLTVGGGFAIAKGWVTKTDWSALVNDILAAIGVLAPMVGLLWSMYDKMRKQRIAAVAALPEVKTVVLNDPSLAARLPDNVVSR